MSKEILNKKGQIASEEDIEELLDDAADDNKHHHGKANINEARYVMVDKRGAILDQADNHQSLEIRAEKNPDNESKKIHWVQKNGNHYKVLGSWAYNKDDKSHNRDHRPGWKVDQDPPKALKITNESVAPINNIKVSSLNEGPKGTMSEEELNKATLEEANLAEDLIKRIKNAFDRGEGYNYRTKSREPMTAKQRMDGMGERYARKSYDTWDKKANEPDAPLQKAIRVSGEDNEGKDPTGHGRDFDQRGKVDRADVKRSREDFTKKKLDKDYLDNDYERGNSSLYRRMYANKPGNDKNNERVTMDGGKLKAFRQKLIRKYMDQHYENEKQEETFPYTKPGYREGKLAGTYHAGKIPNSQKNYMKGPVHEALMAGKITTLVEMFDERIRERTYQLLENESLLNLNNRGVEVLAESAERNQLTEDEVEALTPKAFNLATKNLREAIEQNIKGKALYLIHLTDKELRESQEIWDSMMNRHNDEDQDKWSVGRHQGTATLYKGFDKAGTIKSNMDGSHQAHSYAGGDCKDCGSHDTHHEAMDAIIDHHQSMDSHKNYGMKTEAKKPYPPSQQTLDSEAKRKAKGQKAFSGIMRMKAKPEDDSSGNRPSVEMNHVEAGKKAFAGVMSGKNGIKPTTNKKDEPDVKKSSSVGHYSQEEHDNYMNYLQRIIDTFKPDKGNE